MPPFAINGAPDFGRAYRAVSVSQVPDSFVADCSAAFVQKAFQFSTRQGVPKTGHHGQADNLRTAFCRSKTCETTLPRWNKFPPAKPVQNIFQIFVTCMSR